MAEIRRRICWGREWERECWGLGWRGSEDSSTTLDYFGGFVDGGIYIIGGFKGNKEINPGVKQILKLFPVGWSRRETRRSRGQDRVKVKGQQNRAVVGG